MSFLTSQAIYLIFFKIDHFNTLLENNGLGGFPESIVNNLLGLADYSGEGLLYYQTFVWLWEYLTAGKNFFNAVAQNGVAQVTQLDNLLIQLHYKLDPSTFRLLYVVVDREFKGVFGLNEFIFCLTFLRFAHNQFTEADVDKTGGLTFQQIKDTLPDLGLEDATEAQARKLFDEVDLDKSGTVEFEEFVGLVVKLRFPDLVARLG